MAAFMVVAFLSSMYTGEWGDEAFIYRHNEQTMRGDECQTTMQP